MEIIKLPSKKIRLVLTERCNLDCQFCHEEGISKPFTTKFSPERLHSIIKIAKNHGVNKIQMTGGEPLLLGSTLNNYVSMLKDEGIEKISLVTNGTLITKTDIDFSKFYKIRISLHSLNNQTYKYITHSDALEKVINGISYLTSQDVKLALNVVLLRRLNDNKESLTEIINFAEQNEVGEIQFMEALPTNTFTKNYHISIYSLEEIFESISNYTGEIDWGAKVYVSKRGVKLVLMDCPCSGKHCDYCKEGKLSMYLTPDEIKPCMLGKSIPLGAPDKDIELFKQAMREFYPSLDS